MKSHCIALTLLIFGGFFGLHHFYLGRNRHAIIYLFTLGGFGIGVFYDLFRLGYYVRWANFHHDHDFKEEYISMVRKSTEPSMSLARGFAITMVSQMFGN